MKIDELMKVLELAAKLKENTRHAWLPSGRRESVAEHTFRLCVMAYFVKDEFPEADIDRVIRMCLFHDFGEAFTGDIPTFDKTGADEQREEQIVCDWVRGLPRPYNKELSELFAEMEAQESTEARLYKALDRMEAVITHNEGDISTWLSLEYELQQTYGEESVAFSDYLKNMKAAANRVTREKISLEKISMEKKSREKIDLEEISQEKIASEKSTRADPAAFYTDGDRGQKRAGTKPVDQSRAAGRKRVRCIALDLDGTTLRGDSTLSRENLSAIRAAIGAGVEVVLASGRTISSIPDELLSMPGIRYAITSNGASVYARKSSKSRQPEGGQHAGDCPRQGRQQIPREAAWMRHPEKCAHLAGINGKPEPDGIQQPGRTRQESWTQIRSCHMTRQSVEKILELTKDYEMIGREAFVGGIPYAVKAYVEDPVSFGAPPNITAYVRASRTPVSDIHAFVLDHIGEIEGLDFIVTNDLLRAYLKNEIPRCSPDVVVTSSVKRRVETVHADAGKEKALRFVLGRLGLSMEETAAFGDADNDAGMLAAAGYGFAMANATPAAAAAAGYRTASNEKDGVAEGIRYLLDAHTE